MKIKNFDINNIRDEFNKYIDNKAKQENYGNEFEKKIKILKSGSTTKVKLLNDNNENQNGSHLDLLNILDQSYVYLYNINRFSNNSLDSTCLNSKSSISISQDLLDKQFNLGRSEFCLKHKLYDIPLTKEFENFNHPIKYQINDEYYSYVYSPELKTYCITVSGFLFKPNMINNTKINIEYKGSKFNNILGLYMCGKDIKLNENVTKKCASNEFICKDCIKLNKEIYNLKDKYLINIYGRVAKKNKGVYHCFGHFLVNDKIEECITSYTCNACLFLNSFYNYFHS